MREEAKEAMENQDDSDEDFDTMKKSYTIEDITVGMGNTKLSKRRVRGKKGDDAVMEVTKEIKKPEKNSKNLMLKKKAKGKRTRSQLLH